MLHYFVSPILVQLFLIPQDASSEPSYKKWLSRPRPRDHPGRGSLQEDEMQQVHETLQLPAVEHGAVGKQHQQYGTVYSSLIYKSSGDIKPRTKLLKVDQGRQ